jgi:hypothetical protein
MVATLFAAVAAGAAWWSARASAAAVEHAERDRRVERLVERRARFESMRAALIRFSDKDSIPNMEEARFVVHSGIPLREEHEFPQLTRFHEVTLMINEVPTQEEAWEAAERALGEVGGEITRLDQQIAKLES